MSQKAKIVKGSGGFGGPLEIGIEGKKIKLCMLLVVINQISLIKFVK